MAVSVCWRDPAGRAGSGKLIERSRVVRAARIYKHAAAGVTSDHELTSADDALEKLRARLTLEIAARIISAA